MIRAAAAAAPRIVALVLAGGRSQRFGAEKAMALWEGRPLIAWAVEAIAPGAARLAVNAPAPSGAAAWAHTAGLTVVDEAQAGGAGPLRGVVAGLRWAVTEGADALITTPCDTPRLPCDLAPRLIAARDAAYAVTADGPHSLCALWPVGALEVLETLLVGDRHPPVLAALDAIGARAVRFENASAFANVNTPDALAALAERPAHARSSDQVRG